MNDDQQQQQAAAPEPQTQEPTQAEPQVSEPTAQNASPSTITGNAGLPSGEPAADNKAPAAEPISYDLKGSIPEGWEFDQAANDEFLSVIKDTGLSNEQANAITAYGYKWAQGLMDAADAKRVNEITSWGEATKKELGAQFDSTVALCGTAIEFLEKQNPGLREALNSTGAGNRIEIVRAFAELGRLLSSDPGKLAGAGVVKNSASSSRYPNTDFSRYR